MILAKSSEAAFTHNLQIYNIFLIENAEHLRYTMFRFTGKEAGRMIYITGDTHGGFQRFGSKYFPQQKNMGREDYVIITGDFGGLWDGSNKDQYWLDWLEEKPFTTLFVDGNHENFDLLNALPERQWNGGFL